MPFSIDETSYRKDTKETGLSVGQGYGMRAGNIKPTSIIIHSTNGNKGSTFEAEAKYLQYSRDVSAHFLVGKAGQLAQILPPDLMAWHSGQALTPWFNLLSIGVECHHAVGDTWPVEQMLALTWLVRQLMARYKIPKEMIETHRKVALPAGRKSDPDDWGDQSFYAWRGALVPSARTYRVRTCAPILEAARADARIALGGKAVLIAGDTVLIDNIDANGWAHIAREDVRRDVGFVLSAVLEPV